MVWAVILAAGESKRMGEPKLLLPFAGQAMIESVIGTVLESGVEGTVVVLGASQEKLEEQIRRFPVKVVYNADFAQGMLSSVQKGIQALPASAEAAVVILGDQPGIPASVIKELIRAFKTAGKGIAVPVFRGRRGHPLLLDLKYREEIGRLNPAIGLRELLQSHHEDVLEVGVRTKAVLHDIDNRADYRAAVERRDILNPKPKTS